MSDLRDLYQQVILDHYRSPRNFGALEAPCRRADGHNPLCGDRVSVFLDLAGGVVRRVRFEGAGCAISTASASLMTEAVEGRPVDEVEALFRHFQAALLGEGPLDEEAVGKLAVLGGVREYPVRVKCATLPWHTLHAALQAAPGGGDGAGAIAPRADIVSTE